MYAPTFRGGSQETNRSIEVGDHFPDYKMVKDALEKRFGGTWYILLRLHPQLVARHMQSGCKSDYIVDVSREDDMYEILAGCDAFMTDYSSAAFDAAVMEIPIFLYCDDYDTYEQERGKLLWNLAQLPFLLADSNEQLINDIMNFDEENYRKQIIKLFMDNNVQEDGKGSEAVTRKLIEGEYR